MLDDLKLTIIIASLDNQSVQMNKVLTLYLLFFQLFDTAVPVPNIGLPL